MKISYPLENFVFLFVLLAFSSSCGSCSSNGNPVSDPVTTDTTGVDKNIIVKKQLTATWKVQNVEPDPRFISIFIGETRKALENELEESKKEFKDSFFQFFEDGHYEIRQFAAKIEEGTYKIIKDGTSIEFKPDSEYRIDSLNYSRISTNSFDIDGKVTDHSLKLKFSFEIPQQFQIPVYFEFVKEN